ncbi:Membrane transporter [Aphelenchoides bicaudatus]|nr:Membrane transporter [Aphelenchoides bicaudatus]
MEHIRDPPSFWSWHSVRFRMVILLAFGFAVHASIRGVLGMALVCMVVPNVQPNQTLVSNELLQVNWDLREISAIFIFFYTGNFFSVFGSHYFTLNFGPKNIISWGIIVSVICTWMLPLIFYISQDYFFTAMLRFFTGIAQGFFIPCASLIISRWFAEHERSTAMAIFTNGNQLGLATAMFFTAEFCKVDFLYGWPLSFIVYGFLGVIFFCIWLPFASNQPRESSMITAAELSAIRDKHNNSQVLAAVRHETPFTKILFSPVVLAVCLCSFCQSFAIVIVSSYLPTLYRSALGLNLSQNAFWSAIPFAVQILSKLLFGIIADYAKSKHVDVDLVTKVSNSIASFVPALMLLPLNFVEDQTLMLILLTGSLAMTAGYVSGYNTSIVTIAPPFTSVISAYAQAFAHIGSITAPIFVGFATEESTLEEWMTVFQVISCILIFTGIAFIVFGSAKVQKWSLSSNIRKATALRSLEKSTIGLTQFGSLSLIEEASD